MRHFPSYYFKEKKNDGSTSGPDEGEGVVRQFKDSGLMEDTGEKPENHDGETSSESVGIVKGFSYISVNQFSGQKDGADTKGNPGNNADKPTTSVMINGFKEPAGNQVHFPTTSFIANPGGADGEGYHRRKDAKEN